MSQAASSVTTVYSPTFGAAPEVPVPQSLASGTGGGPISPWVFAAVAAGVITLIVLRKK